MRKRAVSLILCLCMVLSLVPVPVLAQNVENDNPFADVEESDWFYDGVQYVFEHELMKGTSSTIFETLFEPERATQRGMIVTILYRLDGSPPVTDTCHFEDVPRGSNYENAIIWAASNGIVTGYTNTSFGPYDDITRQQMAAILYRYSNVKHYDVAKQVNLDVFTDSSRISNYARIPLSWANAEGLINGITPIILAPTEKVTRAQSAVILTRFCENIAERIKPSPTATYTVTFDLNYTGAGTNQTVSVEQGKTVSEPDAPKRSGYKFKGWYTAPDTQKGILFDFNTAINADITLYAKWTFNSTSSNHSSNSNGTHTNVTTYYTVTFNTNNGNVIQPQSVVSGNVAVRPTDPIREGYVFGGWYSDSGFNNPYNFALAVTSNITLYAKWIENGPTTYKVSFDLNYEGANNNIPDQELNPGEKIEIPDNPERTGYIFAGWSTTSELTDIFMGYNDGIDRNYTLYAYWVDNNDLNDTDGDGLPNYLEIAYGTDKNRIDTDGDGLTDYQEIMQVETSPLTTDTDNDGISDYDEDYDEDGLTNGHEYSIATNPLLTDSDWDGLTDYEEINQYRTNPLQEDTDGDGASDGIEVLYGTNPLVAEAHFTDTAESDPVSEYNPVAISVVANVTGEQLGTVGADSVNYADNPLLSSTIPGYMGNAYELSANGNINNATVTFSYDTSLGTIGEHFEPRIYYFNSDTGELEELPNQTVTDGEVSVSVNHFSTYILLNKEEFDAFWENEIVSPIVDSGDEEATLRFAFVIDYSWSMVDNDPAQLCKKLSKEFVSKLRDGKDQATVIKFVSVATVVSGLTSNKVELNNAIDSISYDNGRNPTSGTNGADGLRVALEQLNSSDSANQYIVFITDGADTVNTYSYDTIIDNAVEAGIKIYAVGMGNASESILRKLADSTGGKYYHATATTNTEELVEIEQVFEEIEKETVDLTTDSNNDGIPDYYNQLILEGKLGLSTGACPFIGYNFNYSEDSNATLYSSASLMDSTDLNMSDDFDGDGLKNGEEIKIVDTGSNVYLNIISDPTNPDSDGDNYSDSEEATAGTDPMKYSYSPQSAVRALTDDELYLNYLLAEQYDESTFMSIGVNLADVLNFSNIPSLVFAPTTDCKKLYLDYFKKQSNVSEESDIFKLEWLSSITEGQIDDVNKLIKALSSSQGVALDNPSDYLRDLYVLRSKLKTNARRLATARAAGGNQTRRIKQLEDASKELSKELNGYWITKGNWSIKLTNAADRYKHWMDKKIISRKINNKNIKITRGDMITIGVTIFTTGLDVRETLDVYSEINANAAAYTEHLEMLSYLSQYGDRKIVRDAASQLYDMISKGYVSFWEKLGEIVPDILSGATGYGLVQASNFLAEREIPVLGQIMLLIDGYNLLIDNVFERAKAIDSALYYESLILVIKSFAEAELVEKTHGYDSQAKNNGVDQTYLTHLAQLRIVGENNFVNYAKNWGLISLFLNGNYEQAKQTCKENITRIRNSAATLKLELSPGIQDFDDD